MGTDSIAFQSDIAGLTQQALQGFFVGWPDPPTAETLLALLQASSYRWLALDTGTGRCVGYITALSDGVLFSYISSLEVLPEYQGRGIGTELVHRMMSSLTGVYATDLVCDEALQPFYEACGMVKCPAMVIRRRTLLQAKP